jgi:hypothetical protein
MDLVELTKYIVSNLVKNTDKVEVTLTDGEDKIINVTVAEDDIGAVIGRGGKIANSIRNVVQAAAYINNAGRVRVNIDSK